MHSYKPDGSETYIAVLDDKEKAILATEINYIHQSMFPEKVNFFNPVNWHTDSTRVDFEFDGEIMTSHVNEDRHVVIVDGFHYEKHKIHGWSVNPWSKDNYHNFEINFYAPSIRQNALDRIDAMIDAKGEKD